VRQLHLTGSPSQRGEAHGESLRELIAEGLERWESSLVSPPGVSIGDHQAAFLSSVDYGSSLDRWVPGLREEIAGIARGACQPLSRVFFYNLCDEYWCWDAIGLAAKEVTFGACSAIGLESRDGRPSLIAQNLDLPFSFDGSAIVVEIEEADYPRKVALTAAGTVGYCGANEEGVAVCCNALPSLRAAAAGVPVLGCVRGILRSSSLAEVEAFLREAQIAAPQNYLVGDSEGVANFECSANQVVCLGPTDGRVWHTNHPFENPDRIAEDAPSLVGTSHERAAFLEQAVPSLDSGEDVLEALRDRTAPLCRVGAQPTDSHTWGTILMSLSQPPTVEIAPGPPDRTELERIW
jgi:isopenicillin-N N-acyltransferase like protein